MATVLIRKVTKKDVPKIVELQNASFADMAAYGMTWPSSYLYNHIRIFPEGQFCVEINGKIVGSSSSLIVTLKPEHAEHTWNEVTGQGLFTNHDPHGDSLYGADISVHPDFQNTGLATMMYDARKGLARKMNLRRVIAGGRLYNYFKHAKKMTAEEYVGKVVKGELKDPVLSLQIKNGFKLIKVLPNYLYDKRSLNYASFIEWLNPDYRVGQQGF
jgi:ribosomal protein S18 acetylase RimI-like enzyme